ncbi:MAG TPA: hypothetical protein VG225_12075 [Terracidiphilus sp.]|jgi:hypothetical protein|nr:hypothetical protein [Terracidiphilus sp.]
MGYFTRVLSKDEEFPPFDELAEFIRTNHPGFKLTIEEGHEEEWESLLLSGDDEVEVAVLERNPVSDNSLGQGEIAEFIEETQDCKPETGVQWLHEFLADVKTIYAFQHLQGSDTEEGGNALHAFRAHLWERGDAILQADLEGFTNEEGYHIVWQFSDSVSGPWNMGVLQDGTWHHFKMDLGDPDHRAAFLSGEMPGDLSAIRDSGPRQ